MSDQAPIERVTPERAAALGFVVNAALAGVKLFAGIAGQSFALVADAAESMTDILGSVLIWGALLYGGRPPDAEHPFGHGKAESLAALTVGVLIVVAGLGIGFEAVRGLLSVQESPRWWTLPVIILVIVAKEVMFRTARRSARREDSSAGLADAWHHRSDAISSLATLVGVSVAVIGGTRFAHADDWAALAAAGVIVVNGVLLVRRPYAELLDRAAPEVGAACERAALGVKGIRAIEQVHARRVGRVYRVIMHAEVDPDLSVREAHNLTGRVKEAVREAVPRVGSVLIHVEPFEGARVREPSDSPLLSD